MKKQIIEILGVCIEPELAELKAEQIIEIFNDSLTDELLDGFKETCLKYPHESGRSCYELAKGWYDLRDFKMNIPLDKPIKL